MGYGRAARLIDFMAEDGIVGTYNGSQAREVLVTIEQWQTMNGEAAAPEPAKPQRRNRILPDAASDESDEDAEVDEADDGEGEEYDVDDEAEDENPVPIVTRKRAESA